MRRLLLAGAALSGSGVVVLALTALAGLAVAFEAPVPLRTPVVLAFFLVVPGLALVDLLPMDDTIVRAAVTTSISVAAAVLVSLVMLALNWWHPKAGLAFLGLASASLVLTRAAIRSWRRSEQPLDLARRSEQGAEKSGRR